MSITLGDEYLIPLGVGTLAPTPSYLDLTAVIVDSYQTELVERLTRQGLATGAVAVRAAFVTASIGNRTGLENANRRASTRGEIAVRPVIDRRHVRVPRQNRHPPGQAVRLDKIRNLAPVLRVTLPAIIFARHAIPGDRRHPKNERTAGVTGGEQLSPQPGVLSRTHQAAPGRVSFTA